MPTFWIWLYVLVTGVVIYLMLYHSSAGDLILRGAQTFSAFGFGTFRLPVERTTSRIESKIALASVWVGLDVGGVTCTLARTRSWPICSALREESCRANWKTSSPRTSASNIEFVAHGLLGITERVFRCDAGIDGGSTANGCWRA